MNKSTVKDMTKGSPFRLLLIFSIPIFIGNIFQQIYSLVDSIIVGKFLGEDALAAVGVTGTIIFFLFSLVIGLTGGIAIVISQYFGAGDLKTVKKAFGTSIYAVIGVSVIVTILGLLLSRPILVALNTPDNIIDDAHIFISIFFIGTFTTVLYNWIASVLRALGDSITPLIFLMFSSVINVGLDLWFIISFGMGVAGAACATVIAQLISGILCIIWAFYKMPVLRLKREDLVLDVNLLKSMLKIGLPTGIQFSFISISVMLMQGVINVYGSTVIAGYVAAIKIEQLAMQCGNSIGMAAGTYTGQNVGAGDYDRVEKGFKASALLIIGCCVIISPILFFFGDQIMTVFVDKGETAKQVTRIGGQYLRVMSFSLVTVGILQIFQNMLRSAGDVSITMVMGVSEVITRVLVAFTFSAIWGYAGVWWATPITWISAMVVGAIRYYSGKWKTKRLV